MRGRPRKPSALQKLKNAGRRPGREAAQGRTLEPKWTGDGSLPPPPPGLAPKELEAWRFLAEPLQFKIFSAEDVVSFHGMVRMWMEWKTASDHVLKFGQTTRTEKGVVLSAHMKAFMELSTKLLNFYSRFGMTPADRSRVAAKPTEKEVNPDAEFSA